MNPISIIYSQSAASLFIAMATLIINPATILAKPSASDYLEKADTHTQTGEYQEAIKYLEQVKTIWQKQEKTETVNYQQLQTELTIIYYQAGVNYAQDKQFQQAIEHYNKAIAVIPDYAAAYANRGMAHYHQNDSERAIQDLEKATNLYQQQGKPEISQQIKQRLNKLQFNN
jgi:tetratricopeptide (TPR) repeat protein